MKDLSALSAFTGFGFSRMLLYHSVPVRPEETDLQPLAALLDRLGLKRVAMLGGAPTATCPEGARRHESAYSAEQLVSLGSWAGHAEAALADVWPPDALLLVHGEFLAALADPRPLVRAIRQRCMMAGSSVLFSCPRHGHPGLCWTGRQLEEFLGLAGFQLEESRHTPTRHHWIATCADSSYAEHLQGLGLDGELRDATRLLVTNEDASLAPSGGIGTYTRTRKHLDPRLVVLYASFDYVGQPSDRRTVLPKTLLGPVSRESLYDGLGLIEAVRVLLLLLPDLSEIEFQDYQSIGFRLVQSKRTGGLPATLCLRAFLHGAIDYVRYGSRDDLAVDYSPHDAALAVRDSYILSYADENHAPSRYLGETLLQGEFGYSVNNLRVTPLPFPLEALPTVADGPFVATRRIVFIGKYNALKGWSDFIGAMELLHAKGALSGITEIVSLAPLSPPAGDAARLDRIATYKARHLAHDELLTYAARHRSDSLFVVPSRSENYPFVILEQLLLGTLLIGYASGGTVEVVGDPDHVRAFFTAPNAVALADRIAEVLQADPGSFTGPICEAMRRTRARQDVINSFWTSLPRPERAAPRAGLPAIDISIVVPVYNTEFIFLSELFASLRGSMVRPKEVIVVDDGSEPGYSAALEALCERELSGYPSRICRQENRGLAGARNRGLAESGSEFTFFIDGDDLLLPSTLQTSWLAMMADRELVACTGFGLYFSDWSSLPKATHLERDGVFWKPLGIPEARALALYENQYMTANVMVRTGSLREFGGWDEEDRSMWEDWALFSRLAWSGKRFSIVPESGFLYRNTPGSMSKTYSRYFGRRRLVRNIPGLTRLDANIAMSLASGSALGAAGLSGPGLSRHEVELIALVRRALLRPRLRRMAIFGYRLLGMLMRVWRTARS